jgi:hypothetical protein
MVEFDFGFKKFGDPLLDPSTNPSICYCLIDREHHKVILALSDLRFPSLKEETRMIWLREFGTVQNAFDFAYQFPASILEINASISPPAQYSASKTISVDLEGKFSREDIAWFSRAFWNLLEVDQIPEETRHFFQLNWKNYSDQSCSSPLRQFLQRPRVISQIQKETIPTQQTASPQTPP